MRAVTPTFITEDENESADTARTPGGAAAGGTASARARASPSTASEGRRPSRHQACSRPSPSVRNESHGLHEALLHGALL